MPDKQTIERARADKRAGKSASTQAGEFVHREIDKIRGGEHGAKNAKQAIAIGLSEARRAGVDIPDKSSKRKSSSKSRPTRKSSASKSRSTRKSSASKSGATRKASGSRKAAALKALKKMPRRAASHRALSRQAHSVARRRSAADRSASAKKAARTRARAR